MGIEILGNQIAGVDSEHGDFEYMKDEWKKCRDVFAGSKRVKEAEEDYLPRPTGQSKTEYDAYRTRARFFNGTRRTVQAMLGQVYRSDPVIDGVEALPNNTFDNIDSGGGNTVSFTKKVAEDLFIVGRVGVLVDHTVLDDETLGRPYLAMYRAESIINWRSETINGTKKLSMVVLKESYFDFSEKVFKGKPKKQYRVLRLDENNQYVQEVWRKAINKVGLEKDVFELVSRVYPLINSQKFDFIPFYICNSNSIGEDIEEPVINDLVDVNIGHYVNSAEFEHELHWAAIKTPIFPGLAQDQTIVMGRPTGCKLEAKPYIMESTPGSIIKDEMTAKEQRMAVLGAQIIAQKGRYVEAAETAKIQASGESGILAGLARMLSKYFTEILQLYLFWAGFEETVISDVSISFNTDFEPGIMTAAEAVQLSSLVDSGKMSWETFFYNLQRGEMYPEGLDPDTEKERIEEQQAERQDRLITNMLNMQEQSEDNGVNAEDENVNNGNV